MSFDTPNGTRGARQPKASRFMNWANGRAIKHIRTKGGTFMGLRVLVLNTIGKKTGAERATPVGWFGDGENRWLIVASAAGGANNPAWYYNIAAHPDRVSIDLDKQHIDVVPEQLHGADRDRAWAKITTESPRFKQYETKTDRVVPVIRLTAK